MERRGSVSLSEHQTARLEALVGVKPDAVYILGGGIIRHSKNGDFFLPPYLGAGNSAAGGGALRMIAGADLGVAFPQSSLYASGGSLREAVPSTAEMTRLNLVRFGISETRIRVHEKPLTTSMEIVEVIEVAGSFTEGQNLVVCTNDFHIPRSEAMYGMILEGDFSFLPTQEYEDFEQVKERLLKALVALRGKQGVTFIAAEDVLHITRPRFHQAHHRISNTDAYTRRVALETQGLQDLLNGVYSARVNER